jgi:hypothetical protein
MNGNAIAAAAFCKASQLPRKRQAAVLRRRNDGDECEAKCMGSLQKTLPSFFCQPRLDVLLCRVAFAQKG